MVDDLLGLEVSVRYVLLGDVQHTCALKHLMGVCDLIEVSIETKGSIRQGICQHWDPSS